MKKKTEQPTEETQPEIAAQSNNAGELQALKATAYELVVERVRIENILRQVEARINELQPRAN